MGRHLRVAASGAERTDVAADELIAGLGADDAALVCLFASPAHDLAAISRAAVAAYPGAVVVGASTCGEVGPLGCTVGGVAAWAVSAPSRAAAMVVTDLSTFQFDGGKRLVRGLADRLGLAGTPLDSQRHCFITLTDGLSGMEEILMASIGFHAPGIPLVGGSAGDDFRFERTWVACGGAVHTQAAVVVLLEPNVPFHPFHVHHYTPSERPLVVTAAEPTARHIMSLDGRPASEVLAEMMALSLDALLADPVGALRRKQMVFGFRSAGTTFLRSVMNVDATGLLMGGATDEGTVLRAMNAGDLVAVTDAGVQEAIHALDAPPGGMLLFNCGGRIWEAQVTDCVGALADAMTPIPAAGFTTYGEQFGPVQVNHTLTGLLLGAVATDG